MISNWRRHRFLTFLRVAAIFSPNQAKLNYMEALKSTSLEYTAVNNGVFMDYWVVPHIKSYLGGGITFAIDMANKAAAIPGSGNTPVVFSYSFDIGNLVAALLTLPTWERETYIVGDRITWNEFLAIAEEARGSKFKTSYDPLDSLKNTCIQLCQDRRSRASARLLVFWETKATATCKQRRL
jgi:nucleoside-diphosphate-sugar epimerase